MKQAIAGFLIGFALHFVISQLTKPAEAEDAVDVAQLQSVNTSIIEELGRVSELLYENTDVMQRFSHFTDHHAEVRLLCPECYPDTAPDDLGPMEDEDTLPEQDLLGDAKEIHMGLQRVSSSLSNQQQTLRYTLTRLREGAVSTPADSEAPTASEAPSEPATDSAE